MRKCNQSKLWLYFTGLVFATILLVFLLIIIVWFLLFKLNLITSDPLAHRFPIVLFSLGSLLLGVVIALFVGRLMIRPIQTISHAFDELSRGNFSVRVPEQEKIQEIRDLAKHFNAMTYDLSHIETLRNDFVANVSHEFKTPIAAIEGYATLLQDPHLSREKHDYYVTKIIDNSRRLTSLSSNILMLSKLENQELIPDKKEYRFDEQLRKCILMLENKWAAKNIEFDMELPLCLYFGSEPLLDQVWINLIDNAIKHSPENGVIHIELLESEHSLCVKITDHGDGMSEEVQKHMFEKFYQGDSSRKADGNGLGLALVKRILDLCQGTVSVKSTPGCGCSFTILLPLHT